jgi:uncharacterized RDD family membrane protein YckC
MSDLVLNSTVQAKTGFDETDDPEVSALANGASDKDVAGPKGTAAPNISAPGVLHVAAPNGSNYAGFPKRAVAWLVDGLLVITASIGTASIVGILLGLTVFPLCSDVSLASAIATYTGYAVGLGVYVLYYMGFECSHLQATPGKLLVSLVVTDMKGSRLTPGRSLYRLIGKFLSGFLFCFGFFLCGVTERKQTLHDILAHTLVLETKS